MAEQQQHDDGGPAMPVPSELYNDGCMGMSLRDYFAAKFAAAWVQALGLRSREPGYSDKSAALEANRIGLMQADAMLAARKEQKP